MSTHTRGNAAETGASATNPMTQLSALIGNALELFEYYVSHDPSEVAQLCESLPIPQGSSLSLREQAKVLVQDSISHLRFPMPLFSGWPWDGGGHPR